MILQTGDCCDIGPVSFLLRRWGLLVIVSVLVCLSPVAVTPGVPNCVYGYTVA